MGGGYVVVEVALELRAPARADAWLCREVEDNVNAVKRSGQVHRGQVGFHKLEVLIFTNDSDVCELRISGVVVRERVDAHDATTLRKQVLGQMGADEPSAACD